MEPYENISRLYLWEYRNWLDDISFYLKTLRQSKANVLELACGTGRVACALAREGFHVTGLDSSKAMLELARAQERELSATRRLNLGWILGDMSRFRFDSHFDYILIPFSSFAFLTSRKDRESCLQCARGHLSPGGCLIVDLFAPDYGRWAEHVSPRRFVRAFFAEVDEGQLELVNKFEQFERDPFNGIMRINLAYERYHYNDSPRVVQTTLELAMLTHREMEYLLERAGFRIDRCIGNYRDAPFDGTSPRMIYVASTS